MDTVREKVLKETKQFRAMVNSLLTDHEGEWVLFLDGSVKRFHSTEQAAYEEGLDRFGHAGGFVVARVEKPSPVPISAGIVFGLPAA